MARPPKFDDTEVLDRAVDLFWRRGVDNVSIRDLETALDLRAPSIYRRFENKENLVALCVDRYVESEVNRRIEHFLTEGDPLAGLRRFFASALRAHPNEAHSRGCLLTATAGQGDGTSDAIQSAVVRGLATIEEAFRVQIGRAVDRSQLTTSDIEGTAKALLLSFQGLLVLARAGNGGLDAHIDATFDLLVPRSAN